MNERKVILSPLQRLFGEDFNPALLGIIIRKNLIWCLLIMVVIFSAAFLFLRYTVPAYEVNASLIEKSENTAQELNLQEVGYQSKTPALDLEKDIEIMRSNVIIDRVIDSLDLLISYYAKGNILNNELYKSSPFTIDCHVTNSSWFNVPLSFRILSETTYQVSDNPDHPLSLQTFSFDHPYQLSGISFNAHLNKNAGTIDALKAKEYFFIIHDREALSSNILNTLQVAPSAPVISLALCDPKPQKAADILNAICRQFLNYEKERKTESETQILKFIDDQIDSISKDLNNDEMQMTNFKLQHGITITTMDQDLANDLKTEHSKMQDLMQEYSQLDYFKKYFVKYQDSTNLLYGVMDENTAALNDYIKQLDDLQMKRKSELLQLSPSNPEMININEQVSDMKHNILTNIENAQSQVQSRMNDLQQQISSTTDQFAGVPGIQSEYEQLARLADLKEKYYLLLLDKKSSFSISKAGFVSDYTILKDADVPGVPVYPNPKFIWMLALALGIILSFFLFLIKYLLHDKILSPTDIVHHSSATILGVIPRFSPEPKEASLIVSSQPISVFAEAFRSLRANLDYVSSANKNRLLTVTSTVSGEGKTFVALNMAGILAIGGKKVLLIDLDLRKPQIHHVFHVDGKRGVSGWLSGKYDAFDCIQSTGFDRFDFMPAGYVPSNPAEFLMSTQIHHRINELLEHYDVVVADTAPVGIVTDSIPLLKKADYPIYVVRADYSSRNFINHINYLINNHQMMNLSVVVNDMGRGASSYNYSNGYRYGYGYGADSKYVGRYQAKDSYFHEPKRSKSTLRSRIRRWIKV